MKEHLTKVNIPTCYQLAYPNQYTDIEIPFGSKDRTIVPDAIKIVFNLDIESTDKARVLLTM